MANLEYKIMSRLGDWPEIFSDLQDVANDLDLNRRIYPDVEFGIMVREVGAWEPNLKTLPEPVELPRLRIETDCPTDPEFAHMEEGLDG